MSENGIQVIRPHKYKATTDSAHNLTIAPSLLDQDFTVLAPNQKRAAGDINYIWTREGWLYQPPKGCLHHTDWGSQYCACEDQKILCQNGFKVSMSGKGNCWDTAVVETFFKTRKAELVLHLANTMRCRGRPVQLHQQPLQSTPETFGVRLEKPLGIRKKGSLNEQPERNESGTGPFNTKSNCCFLVGLKCIEHLVSSKRTRAQIQKKIPRSLNC